MHFSLHFAALFRSVHLFLHLSFRSESFRGPVLGSCMIEGASQGAAASPHLEAAASASPHPARGGKRKVGQEEERVEVRVHHDAGPNGARLFHLFELALDSRYQLYSSVGGKDRKPIFTVGDVVHVLHDDTSGRYQCTVAGFERLYSPLLSCARSNAREGHHQGRVTHSLDHGQGCTYGAPGNFLRSIGRRLRAHDNNPHGGQHGPEAQQPLHFDGGDDGGFDTVGRTLTF